VGKNFGYISSDLVPQSNIFANQANLDHLSGDGFPELKRRLVKVLDLGSGPSVLYHAYDQSREKMKGRGLQLQISEFDASAAMLARGVVRPGEQTVGSFSHLGEAYPANTFDVVNMSYSFELADHPARLIKTIHSLLKGNGLFALILPKDTLIPEAFYRGLEAAGFKLRTVQGGQLESKIPETHYRELVREYGEEFAKDIARTAHTRHTYLLAEKTTNGEELSDDFFRIGLSREKMDIEKIKRLRSTEARFGVVPPDLPIEGIVDYDPSKRRDEETLSRWLLGDKIRGHISSMIQLADKLSRQSPDSKERPKILTQLRQKLLLLKNEVELADINNPQRLAILHLFQKGLHNKFFDQWVKHDGKEYLDLMVLLQGGMNDTNGEILPRKRAGGNKTGGTKGRATSQWGLKMAEWIGSKVDPIHGRERFGARYKQFAAAIEWIFGAKVALWGFVATLAFAGAPMGWVLAPAVGVVYGILFVASHFIPKSMAPVTKVNVGMLETVAMGLIYGVLIGATPFLLGAVPLLGVPEFGVQAAAIVWGLAGFLHYLIDKKKESEAKTSPEKPSFTKWEIISPFVGPLFLFFSYVRFMDTDTKTSWAYKIFDFPWFQSINNGYINDLISIPTVWALFFTVASVVNILIKIFKNFFEKKPTHMDRSILGDVAKRKDKITSIVFEAGVFFSLMIGGLLAFNEANSRLFDAMRLLYHSLSDFDGVYRAGVYGGGDILSFLRMFSGTFDPVDLMIFAFEGAASFSFIPVLFYFLPAFRSTVEASQKRRQSPLVSLIATLLKWDALKLNNSKDTIQSPGTDYPRISGIVLKVAIVTIVLGSVAFVWSIASPWVEIPFFEVPKIDAHSATILGAAGFVQGFVPKTPKEAGEQAAWALVAQSANIQGALESVMPVVQNDHMGSIVGEGSSSTDSLSTVLVEIKNDADFRDGFVGVIRTAMEQGNLSPMQMNLLPVLIKGATGQPVAFLHILGKTPKNELATLESLVERTDPNEKSGLSVALVVPAGQTEAVEARIAALKSQGVQVFHVPLRSEGWTGDDLRSLEDQMSTWLEKTNGIMATVGTKVGINPKDIEALNKESKLREALKSAVTLGETIQTFLRYLQALASNA
jgi:SAM-dependent methyltransferase